MYINLSKLKDFFISKNDIQDNLTSTDINKPLSANQGKVLQDNKQNTLISGTNIKTINDESILGSGNLTVSSDTIKGGYISAYEPSLVLIDDTVTTLEITITDIPSNYVVQSVKINDVNDNTVFSTVMYESYTENNISYNKWTIKFPLSNYKDYVVGAGIFMQGTSDYYLYDLEDSIGMPITVSFNDLPTTPQSGG